jgi:hypothetical protein
MTTKEKRRERYHTDDDYRNDLLKRFKEKYYTDQEYKDRKIKQAIKYAKDNVSYTKKYRQQYYKDNREKMIDNTKFHNDNNRSEVLYWYSDGLLKCNECDESHIEFLCIDHIDDSGAEHRRDMGVGGDRIYKYVLKNKFPEGYQVLCNNCNFLKEYIKVQNKPKSTTIYAIAIRKQRLNMRRQALYWYSNGSMKCECCGENDIRVLTIDHINGGGKQHVIKNNIKNLHEYLHYNHYPEGYRILCFNCNKSHGQYGYCPHDKKI